MGYDFSELDVGVAFISAAEKQARREQIPAIREKLRKKGIIASDLKDLRSKSGAPFIECIQDEKDGERKAIASFGRGSPEIAYFCCDFRFNLPGMPPLGKEPDSCGWVKEEMIDIKRSTFSCDHPVMLEIRCKICGNLIYQVKGRSS